MLMVSQNLPNKGMSTKVQCSKFKTGDWFKINVVEDAPRMNKGHVHIGLCAYQHCLTVGELGREGEDE